MSTANLFNSRVYPAKDGLPVIAAARIGDSRERGQYFIIRVRLKPVASRRQSSGHWRIWHFWSSRRSTFLLSLYSYFILLPLAFFFPRLHPVPHPFPPVSDPQSSVFLLLASLLFFFSSVSRPRVSLVRFVSPPRCHPNGVHRLVSTSRGEKEREGEDEEGKRSFSVSRWIVLLFAPDLHAFFERANEQNSRNASFSKLKTGLSASTFGPTANLTVKLDHTFDDFKFWDKYAFFL